MVIEALVRVVRPTGGIGVSGLYVPTDPGAPDSASAKGHISFPFGKHIFFLFACTESFLRKGFSSRKVLALPLDNVTSRFVFSYRMFPILDFGSRPITATSAT